MNEESYPIHEWMEILECMSDGLIVFDFSGKVIAVNRAYEMMTGLSRQEVVGIHGADTATRTVKAEDVDKIIHAFKTALDGEAIPPIRTTLTRRDGLETPVYFSTSFTRTGDGKSKSIVAVIKDMSDIKRSEDALLESEQRFRSFMNSDLFIAFMKDEQGRVVYLNKAHEKRFGVRLDDWIGKTDFEIWPRDVAEQLWENDQQVLSGERFTEVIEEALNPDGTRCYWLNMKFPFHDMSGKRFVGGIGIDITDRKHAEEELKRHRDHLEELVQERTAELEQKRVELEDMNATLKVLLRQREGDKDAMQKDILSNVKTFILPHIEKLEAMGQIDGQWQSISLIKSHLEDITSPFTRNISSEYLAFSPGEIQVASLIRDGNSSKEIASLLNISLNTVHTYRYNIRRKAGLKNNKVNLRSYLKGLG